MVSTDVVLAAKIGYAKGVKKSIQLRLLVVLIATLLVTVGLGCSNQTKNTNTAAANVLADGTEWENTNEAVVPEDSAINDANTNTVLDTNTDDANTTVTDEGTAPEETAPTNTEPTNSNKIARYAEYSETALKDAESYGTPVLFFYQSADQISKDAEADIIANLGTLPQGVTVLKVNYDTATALKLTYNVGYQHTFVQLDALGKEVTSWSGGDAASIVDNFKTN